MSLYYVCKSSGNIEEVNRLVKLGADLNYGLYGACIGGHLDIVNLMVKLGANHFNWGLHYACCGGHLDLVNLMIKSGANNFNGVYIMHANVGI